MAKQSWTREELLLAFNLYCKIPFGQYHRHNKDVIKLAQAIERTPSAVAMKLSNFASFDPHHQQRGVSGLSNASKADRAIWEEFNNDWNRLVLESETILEQSKIEVVDDIQRETETVLQSSGLTPEKEFTGATETEHYVKIRLAQRFFRQAILANYQSKCCICGLPVPQLLIASHIIRWKDSEDLRVNPRNGLCLCAIHDKAFDRGFITVKSNYQILVSPIIHAYLPGKAVQNYFTNYDDHPIILPDKFVPDQKFLDHHQNEYFVSG
jgi:predicted restriction endonuclease